MNCKPGDLAIVVRKGNNAARLAHLASRACDLLIGRTVRVVKLEPDEDGDLLWTLEQEIELPFCIVQALDDALLHPIRDPGEDVPDESTAWLPPVPLHDEVTA